MINLWQLHVFLEVAETGSFSGAAVRLHMTQPGVSQQVRALENYLGTKLFLRRGHGVELTAAGGDLIDPARRMINLSEMTERALMSRREGVSGRVRVGCALTTGSFLALPLIHEFRLRFPDVTIQVEQNETGPLIGSLRSQELDCGFFLGRVRGRGLVHHKVLEDPVTLIVPLNHQWTSPAGIIRSEMEMLGGSTAETGSPTASGASRNSKLDEENWSPAVRPAMLAQAPVILEHGVGESHSDVRRALNDALEDRGLNTRDLKIVLEVPGPAEVASAVAEGIGVGLVPASIARRFVGQVVAVRLEGFVLAQHIYLVYDRKALHSPAVVAWWKFVEERLGVRNKADSEPEASARPSAQKLPITLQGRVRAQRTKEAVSGS